MSKNSKKLDSIVKIDQSRLQGHLGGIVRGTVEETLNAMLDAEADALCRWTHPGRALSAQIPHPSDGGPIGYIKAILKIQKILDTTSV